MNPESRQTIHKGIGFVFSPFGGIDKRTNIKFQSALVERGLEFSATQDGDNQIMIIRDNPTRLELQVGVAGPSVGSLTIIGPHSAHDGELFEREAEAIVRAFNDVWFESNRQLLSCDASVRDLFESDYEHAFQELWVHRLKQREDSLAPLGRPVLGGGIRLVMPPLSNGGKPCQIEVKIESFLRDTKKIFVDTTFLWPEPDTGPIDPQERLKAVDDYIEDNVIPFILGVDNARAS